MTPDEFRRLGHQLIEWVADYREHLGSLPVMSQVKPGAIRAQLPPTPPARGESLDALPRELDEVVMPGITHWNHPRFFAYFPSNTDLASVLADLIASGLGPNAMSWQTSPAATELEEVSMDWLRLMVGLPETFTGALQDTASGATLVALLCARERSTSFSQTRGGLQTVESPLVVYTSDQAHSSVEKAALLAGFGRAHVRAIATDANHALRMDLLRAAVTEDMAQGRHPCAFVASIGTTATTAVDPLREMTQLAAEVGAWVHVDAALAGTAMVVPDCRRHWDGIERADSLVLNPHKWLGAGFDCSAYYVRDPQHLIRVMSTNPTYLRTAHDAKVKNYRDWGIPLGRRFRALKLWMVIRSEGVEGIRDRVERDLGYAQWFAQRIDQASPRWERLAPVPFQTLCIRHRPVGLEGAALDAHNLALANAINATGEAYVTPAVVKGVQLIRVSFGSTATTQLDVEALWELLAETAAGLS